MRENSDPRAKNFKYDTYNKYMEMMNDSEVFDDPAPKLGYCYLKPRNYLSVACLESGLNAEDVKGAIDTLLEIKDERVKALTVRLRKDRTIRSVGNKAFTSLGKRMRSTSPPRQRKPLPSFSEVVGR